MPPSTPPYTPGLAAVFDVVHRLRSPGGCPWDREQTHQSLRPYLLEETYELLEAIDLEDDAKIREELGDVLLQVAMHAEIAAQEGRFDAVQVSESVAAKMVSRHPHVYGDTEVADAAEVLKNWERTKLAEAAAGGEPRQSVIDRVPRAMPALAWTLGMQKRAARVGVEVDGAEASLGRARHQLGALPEAGEMASQTLGDVLFEIVNVARTMRINPEDALRGAGERFAERFRALEARVEAEGRQLADLEPDEVRTTLRPAVVFPPG